MDEVIFGTPEQVRQSAPKIVFLIGRCRGNFPGSKSTGVFSDAERKELIAMELPLGGPSGAEDDRREVFGLFGVLCSFERLYVSYPRSADGRIGSRANWCRLC